MVSPLLASAAPPVKDGLQQATTVDSTKQSKQYQESGSISLTSSTTPQSFAVDKKGPAQKEDKISSPPLSNENVQSTMETSTSQPAGLFNDSATGVTDHILLKKTNTGSSESTIDLTSDYSQYTVLESENKNQDMQKTNEGETPDRAPNHKTPYNFYYSDSDDSLDDKSRKRASNKKRISTRNSAEIQNYSFDILDNESGIYHSNPQQLYGFSQSSPSDQNQGSETIKKSNTFSRFKNLFHHSKSPHEDVKPNSGASSIPKTHSAPGISLPSPLTDPSYNRSTPQSSMTQKSLPTENSTNLAFLYTSYHANSLMSPSSENPTPGTESSLNAHNRLYHTTNSYSHLYHSSNNHGSGSDRAFVMQNFNTNDSAPFANLSTNSADSTPANQSRFTKDIVTTCLKHSASSNYISKMTHESSISKGNNSGLTTKRDGPRMNSPKETETLRNEKKHLGFHSEASKRKNEKNSLYFGKEEVAEKKIFPPLFNNEPLLPLYHSNKRPLKKSTQNSHGTDYNVDGYYKREIEMQELWYICCSLVVSA